MSAGSSLQRSNRPLQANLQRLPHFNSQSWFSALPLCGAKLPPVPREQTAGKKTWMHAVHRSNTRPSHPQIEFVTGTKKGTTTNATATTTTTASTAVAGTGGSAPPPRLICGSRALGLGWVPAALGFLGLRLAVSAPWSRTTGLGGS